MDYCILDKPEQNNRDVRIYTILGRDSISGFYYGDCIRFFYKDIGAEIKDPEIRRFFYSNSFDFDVKEGSILSLKGNPGLNKYKFETGIYVIYAPTHFDVVSRAFIDKYMELEEFDFRYDNKQGRVKSLTLKKVEKEIE